VPDRPYLPQDGDDDRLQIFLRQPFIKHCGDFIVGGWLSVWAMPMRLAAKPWGLAVDGDWSDRRRALVSCHRSAVGSARAWVWSSCGVMWGDRATRKFLLF
jgi:hypothetical protein